MRNRFRPGSMKRQLMLTTAIASASVLLVSMAAPAATAASADPVLAALKSIPASAGLFTGNLGISSTSKPSGRLPLASIPEDPSLGLRVVSATGSKLTVGLPRADEAGDATELQPGIVAYDNGDGSHTVPIAKIDGSVQVATVLESSDAPDRYSYDVGGAATLQADGDIIVVRDDQGQFAGAIAPAWAMDAAGTAVPTHYEASGSTVTQVVDHANGSYTYPIVADPWLGQDLFNKMTTSSDRGQPRYLVFRSGWGAAMSTSTSAVPVFLGPGWDEAKNKWPVLLSKTSLHEQYDCHSIYALLKPDSWNLEKWRPNKSDWGASALAHQCNWG